MSKRIIITIGAVLLVAGLLAGIKAVQIRRMIANASQMKPPPEVVTTAEAREESWTSVLTSVGSLAAVQGVTITAELSGKVTRIAFTPGTKVKKGQLLVQQDTSSEAAQLRAAEARLALARTNLQRSHKLPAKNAISRSDYDSAVAQEQAVEAEADDIRATIRKKTIRAPFTGRLGIRLINLGQVLTGGDPIVSLQAIDPIFVNFRLPQQQLSQLAVGLTVRVTTNMLGDQAIEGKVTAINPQVDASTRNVEVQATLSNPEEQLRPGMFVNVAVVLPTQKKVLAIPATAVLYAPYSDSVFIVEADRVAKGANQGAKVVRQQFIRLGAKRGDFTAVLAGLKAGDVVVSTGVFKLRNGQSIVVDNSLSPKFKLAPEPADR